MGIDERVREDLLAGARGAPQLTETTLEQIDTIFKLVTPSHEETDVPFKVSTRPPAWLGKETSCC